MLLLAAAGPETAYWLGAQAFAEPAPGEPCAVLVLGAVAREIQEKRVAAGVEAFVRAGCGAFVVSGGAVRSDVSEADTMALLAFQRGIPEEKIKREDESRNTWENVGKSLPLMKDYPRVFVVSDSLHAHRGVEYLCRRAPERCPKIFPFGYYEPLAQPGLKLRAALHEAGAWVKSLKYR